MKTKLSPKKFLEKTGYKLYVDDDVVETMPISEGECVFFKLDKYILDDDLEKEYESRGLVAASPYAMLTTAQEKLDEMKYVGTHWKDGKGKWCFCTFRQWLDGERIVNVRRDDADDAWFGFWWFAGLRKSSEIKPSELLDTQSLELRVQKLEDKLKAIAKILS